jgi:hypothetical protein
MPVSDNPNSGSESEIFPIIAKAGIQRDGTEFDSDMFVDGQWCRFQRGRPKKIGGFRMVDNEFNGPIRTVLVHPHSGHSHLICGSGSNLEIADLTSDGIGAGVVNITPTLASGFVPSDLNTWQFAELYDTGATSSKILAHAAPNLGTIDSETNRKLFFGDDDGGIPFTDTTAPQVSGGVVANAPYAFVYGNSGFIAWCVPNTPDDWAGAGSGSARVTKSKIVYGSAVRGGAGQAPALILWSLDSVLRCTFAGGAAVFDFDTVSGQSSILSSAGVIEYDGIFLWPGIDRFLMYNGVVQEVPNNVNINFFFDNLNYNQRQKVWATKISRYGEIWWFFPRGTATECNHAIVYNIRENTWYDTAIMRSAGYFPQVFRWPLWADVNPSSLSLIRPNSGTPATSALGTAANAFDGDPATDCTQTSANGNISYDFGVGVTKPITRVGIISAVTRTYDLIFEYSDANATTWTTAVDPASQSFTADQEYFFDLPDIVSARAWRVRETGGATLNLAEVFFLSHGYMVHQHEFGMNQVIDGVTLSIRSFIQTNSIDYKAKGPLGDRWMGVNRQVMLGRIEPDLIQNGPMTVDVITRRYPRDDPSSATFPMEVATGAENIDGLKMDLTEQGFLVSLRFQSDTQNGFFEMGEIMIMLHPGDASA